LENTDQQIPEEPVIQLVPANLGKRLTNYLIDIIIFSFLVSFLLVLVAPVYPLAGKLMNKQPIGLMEQLMVSFLYGLYMSVMEAVLKGKTIGKYITGTRAVSKNGLPINAQTAFVRGLIRLIPFEQLSAISFPPYPWHDRWSKSIVIDETKSLLPKT
jgi:uncharacterized RDD family membrane protein YckC